MKLKGFIVAICVMCTLNSCTSWQFVGLSAGAKQAHDTSCEFVLLTSNEGYRNYYIVDQLKIDTPIVIITKHEHWMIMPYHTYINFKGTEKDLYAMPDVFFFSYNIPEFIYNFTDVQIMSNGHHAELQYNTQCIKQILRLPTPQQKNIKSAYLLSDEDITFYFVLVSKAKFFGFYYDIIHGDVYPKLICHDNDFIRMLVPLCDE